MIGTIIGCIAISIAAYMLVNSAFGRVYGFHRPRRWAGGGDQTFVGEVAFGVFVGCLGAVFLFDSPIWGVPALLAWIVGYLSQNRANRRHQAEEEELRKMNALEHPGIFDDPPPDDIEATQSEILDLYDAGACTYLGTVPQADVKTIIRVFSDMPEQGANDIFLIYESLEMIPQAEITEESIALLNTAFEQRDYLVLRWMPRP